ncbi:MAG: pilus assembly PilX N-terminal domain-containing protein [Proteobacteria bacterium]|nr:hypothetical protein [Desulfobulbaceae bacterium]MBU4153342.1 pilus assembly PilX N-terminal domain-containing protein [Pseudomonadota bacterium]MDP2106984.1 pilus assembly PilX N-terminal domain-containing protein [Desulfobulbaceae bacterium]
MIKRTVIGSNENGFVLVAVMLMLLVLAFIGITSTTTSNIELQIAGNNKIYNQTFYAADGGTSVGAEVVEQNTACATGFTATSVDGTIDATDAVLNGNIVVEGSALSLWNHPPPTGVSDSDRDIYYPINSGTAPHTNLNIGGDTILAHGSALQMAAGYEGKGKSAASGGGYILYDIFSQRIGISNSQSTLRLQWRHVIGQEGSCLY